MKSYFYDICDVFCFYSDWAIIITINIINYVIIENIISTISLKHLNSNQILKT